MHGVPVLLIKKKVCVCCVCRKGKKQCVLCVQERKETEGERGKRRGGVWGGGGGGEGRGVSKREKGGRKRESERELYIEIDFEFLRVPSHHLILHTENFLLC